MAAQFTLTKLPLLRLLNLVNGAGHEFLSGAGFAQYQNSCIGGRDYLNAFQNGLEGCPLTDHVAVVVIEPDFVLQIKLLGSEPLLHLLELAVCKGVFHGDGNLSCHLHQKIDVFIRPNVAGGSGDFERPQRAIAGDQRNRAGRFAAQLDEPAVFRRGVGSQSTSGTTTGLPVASASADGIPSGSMWPCSLSKSWVPVK